MKTIKSILAPWKTSLEPRKTNLEPQKTNLEPWKTIKTDLEKWKTNLNPWKPIKTDMEPWKTNLEPSKLTRSWTGWLWGTQVITGDSQEEVLIFRDRHFIIIYISASSSPWSSSQLFFYHRASVCTSTFASHNVCEVNILTRCSKTLEPEVQTLHTSRHFCDFDFDRPQISRGWEENGGALKNSLCSSRKDCLRRQTWD